MNDRIFLISGRNFDGCYPHLTHWYQLLDSLIMLLTITIKNFFHRMGQIYHVWNRGVDGRNIFLDDHDRLRFLDTLRFLNTVRHIAIKDLDRGNLLEIQSGERLVAIFAYTLLGNHFHLSLKELRTGGMSKFIKKIGIGYTLYFNIRHERRGRLFERSMQWKTVSSDQYFQHLIAYIHLNALDAYDKDWRAGKMKSKEKFEILSKYKWSSAKLYLGKDDDDLIDVENLRLHYPASCFKNHRKYLCGWSTRNLPEIESRE